MQVRLVAMVLLSMGCASSSTPYREPPRSNGPLRVLAAEPDIELRTSASTFRKTSERELLEQAWAADIVYLGEKHDNPEHHRLQARLLAALVERGARPRVVMEMIDAEQQPIVDRVRAREGDLRMHLLALRSELEWDRSGWPGFVYYAPIFEIALRASLPIVAGGVSRAWIKRLAGMGEPVSAAERTALGLDRALPDAQQALLQREIADAHCGVLPPSALAPMADAQRARDVALARAALVRTEPAAPGPRSVVIAGAGHVRTDRGAPWYAAALEPSVRQLSIAFVESAGPAATEERPFDARWLTERANADEDHCAGLKERMRPAAIVR